MAIRARFGQASRTFRTIFVALLWSCSTTPSSASVSFEYVKLAETGGAFTGLSIPTINDTGVVAFRASFGNGGYSTLTATGGGAPFVQIAATGTNVPGGTIEGIGPICVINNAGQVTFTTFAASPLFAGPRAIYRGDATTTTRIAPLVTGGFFFSAGGWINNNGVVAHDANASSYNDLWVGDGTTSTRVATGTSFNASINLPSINDAGTIVFHASGNSEYIYIHKQGVLTRLATASRTIPAAYVRFGGPDVNAADSVVFPAAFTGGGFGLIGINNGISTTLVDARLNGFNVIDGSPAINDTGNVAFYATLDAGGHGLFAGSDPVADKVVQTGDVLLGETVTGVSFLRGLNNVGQLTFLATLANGQQAIYLATPVPEPAALLPAFGVVAAVLRRRRNRDGNRR